MNAIKINAKKLGLFTLIFMLIFMFVSCDGSEVIEPDSKNTPNEGNNTEDTGQEQEPDSPPEVSNLPDMNFDGHIFKVLTRAENWGDWQAIDVYAETINGETINDAVFQRNTVLEDKYGFSIEQVTHVDLLGQARRSISAGDEAFDAMVPTIADAVSLANANLLYNLNDMRHLDLDRSWWDQSVRNSFDILGRLHMMTGNISISYDDATWVMMFNKQLHSDFGLENIYDLVAEGKWTVDKFYSLTKGVYRDLDSTSQPNVNDLFGFATHENSVEGFFFGSGLNIVGKGSDGVPALVMNTPKISSVLDKMVEILYTSIDTHFTPGDNWADIQRIFESDRALFFGEVLQCVIRLRAMDTNFGLVPYPKWDESQENYLSFVAGAMGIYCVPMTASNPDRTGFILEAMAHQSSIDLTPAYFDTVLIGKQFRDEESTEMLKIIRANRVFDLGQIFDWGNLLSGLRKLVLNGSTDFASMYEQNSAVAQVEIDRMVENLRNED